jgi:hypothetical protein
VVGGSVVAQSDRSDRDRASTRRRRRLHRSSAAAPVPPTTWYGSGRLDIKAAVDLGVLAVEPPTPAPSADLWLGAPLPTPARHTSLLRFRVLQDGAVDFAIFSIAGQRLRTLMRGPSPPGEHTIRWDGLSDRGSATPRVFISSGSSRVTKRQAARSSGWVPSKHRGRHGERVTAVVVGAARADEFPRSLCVHSPRAFVTDPVEERCDLACE